MKHQVYNLDKDFEFNATYGPFWNSRMPKVPKLGKKFRLLGHKVNSLFGIPACPLTGTFRYVELYSKLGYDILTFKSVRTIEWYGNEPPHWRYVNFAGDMDPVKHSKKLAAKLTPVKGQEPSMVNSFGVHSLKPEYWQQEVDACVNCLQRGQMLILSLMPTPVKDRTLVDDCRLLAKLGLETNAHAFEVNFACPNTDGGEGLIYEDLELTVAICETMKNVLGAKHLLVKVGPYKDFGVLEQFMKNTKGVVSGISSTNTWSSPIATLGRRDVFPGRSSAGVSGGAIRKGAQEQIKAIVQLKQKLGLEDFVIVGIGGITKARHVKEYLDLGADAAQAAVGAFANPLLAVEYKKLKD